MSEDITVNLKEGENLNIDLTSGESFSFDFNQAANETDTRANVSEDGVEVVANATDINFRDNANVIDDGDGSVTIDLISDAAAPTIQDDGVDVETTPTQLDFAGGDFDVTNPTGEQVKIVFTHDDLTVAGNTVSLGGSTAIDHADLSNIGASDHHAPYTDEQAQDVVWNNFTTGSNLSFTYDDAGNSASLSISGSLYSDEDAQDAVGNAITTTGTPLSFAYDDPNNSLDFTLDTDLSLYDNSVSQFLQNVVEDATPQLGGNLDAQSNDVFNLEKADFNLLTNGSFPAHQEGRVFYDADDHALVTYNDESEVTQQLGREVYVRVRNNTGSAISNGDVVYINGGQGTTATVDLAKADNLPSARNIGVATHTIEDASFGYITMTGVVRGIDTSAFAEGEQLYVSETTAGDLTASRPKSPNFATPVARVVDSGTQGMLIVLPDSPTLGYGDANEIRAMDSTGSIEEYKAIQDGTTIDFSVNSGSITAETIDSAIDHDALLNFVANEHVDHSTVSVLAGNGLTGGGDITADRTLGIASNGVQTDEIDQSIAPVWTGQHSFDGGLDAGSNPITSVADPSNAQDAATKAYADSIAQGVTAKDSVRAATNNNIDLTSTTDPNPIDGVTLNNGDRVLLKSQSTASENGIYVAQTATDPSTWVRSSDADEDDEVFSGIFMFVEEGTENGSESWILTTNDPITVGTTALNFTVFARAGEITAGDGLSKSGNTINARLDIDDSGANRTGAFGIDFNSLLSVTDDGDNTVTVDVEEGNISHDAIDQTTVSTDDHHARYTDEEAQDAVGTISSGGNAVTVTYDDANNTITTSVDADSIGNSELLNTDDFTVNSITSSATSEFRVDALFDPTSSGLTDGGSIDSGQATFRGYYDSDGTTSVTATARNASIDHLVDSSGSSRLNLSVQASTIMNLESSGDVELASGDLLIQDGSQGDPGLAFSADSDTGIYRTGGGDPSIVRGGTRFIRVRGDGVDFEDDIHMLGNVIDEVGGTPDATTGAIRMANGARIYSRNAGDTANISVFGVDGNNNIDIGDGDANSIVLSAGAVDVPTSLGGNNLIEVGATPDASTGAIRLGNATSILARNSSDTGNFGISFTSGDNVQVSGANFDITTSGKITGGEIQFSGDPELGWRRDDWNSGDYWKTRAGASTSLSGSAMIFEAFDSSAGSSTPYLRLNQGGPVSIQNADLRLATGNTIEDGSGSNRFSITSAGTDVLSPSGGGRIGFYDFNQSAYGAEYQPDPTGSSGNGVFKTTNAAALIQGEAGGLSNGANIAYTGSNTKVSSLDAGSYSNILYYGSIHDFSVNAADIRIATGQEIQDGGGTARVRFRSGRTEVLRDDGTDILDAPASDTANLLATSSSPVGIFDDNSSSQAVIYETDPSGGSGPGVLRTPNAGITVEDKGLNSDGDGLRLRYFQSSDLGEVSSYDADNSSFATTRLVGSEIQLRSTGGTVNMSGEPSNLRLATGQAIEDGSGNYRLQVKSDRTHVFNDAGTLVTDYKAASHTRLLARSGVPVDIYDNSQGATGVQYIVGSPGTLELTNANLSVTSGSNIALNGTSGSGASIANTINWPDQGGGQNAQLYSNTNGEIAGADDNGNETILT